MFFSWVSGFGRHIAFQFFKGLVQFLLMGALFWFLPWWIQLFAGVPKTSFVHTVLNAYPLVLLVCFGGALYQMYAGADELRKSVTPPHVDRQLQQELAIVARLAQFKEVPQLIRFGEGNAGATENFVAEYVFFDGAGAKGLTARERYVVLAHELAHLKFQDAWAFLVVRAGNAALWLQYRVCLLLLFLCFFFSSIRQDLSFAFTAFGAVSGVHIAYGLLALGFSRSREFLADMGAIRFLGVDYRDELISAIAKMHLKAGWEPMKIFHERMPLEIFMSHPSTAARARALRVSWKQGRGGITLREEVV